MIRVLSESHDTPLEIAAVLRTAGGLNAYGEPNYRAVWGRNRLDWIGGRWEDRNAAGELLREVIELRRVPKYVENRWHIERWMPAESYGSPESWALQTLEREDGQRVPALGPYPCRGDYEHCFTVETPSGSFLQLTPAIAREIALAIEFSRNLCSMSRRERISREAARQDREYDSFADTVLGDTNQFQGKPHVSVL